MEFLKRREFHDCRWTKSGLCASGTARFFAPNRKIPYIAVLRRSSKENVGDQIVDDSKACSSVEIFKLNVRSGNLGNRDAAGCPVWRLQPDLRLKRDKFFGTKRRENMQFDKVRIGSHIQNVPCWVHILRGQSKGGSIPVVITPEQSNRLHSVSDRNVGHWRAQVETRFVERQARSIADEMEDHDVMVG